MISEGLKVGMNAVVVVWKNKDVPNFIESNFEGEARDAAYATLAWAAGKWPEIGNALGADVSRTE